MSQTNVTLTCPEGRWNLISFLNVSSSILACSTIKKMLIMTTLTRLPPTCPMLLPMGTCPISLPCSSRSGCIVIEVRSSVGARTWANMTWYSKIWDIGTIPFPWYIEMEFHFLSLVDPVTCLNCSRWLPGPERLMMLFGGAFTYKY